MLTLILFGCGHSTATSDVKLENDPETPNRVEQDKIILRDTDGRTATITHLLRGPKGETVLKIVNKRTWNVRGQRTDTFYQKLYVWVALKTGKNIYCICYQCFVN